MSRYIQDKNGTVTYDLMTHLMGVRFKNSEGAEGIVKAIITQHNIPQAGDVVTLWISTDEGKGFYLDYITS